MRIQVRLHGTRGVVQSLANDIVSSEVYAERGYMGHPRFGDGCERVRKEEDAKDSGTGVEQVRSWVGYAYAACTSRESWTGWGG